MIKIKQVAFAKALDNVDKVVERKGTIPILSHVLLSADADGQVTLTGTDLDIQLTTKLEAEVKTPGLMAIPSAPLNSIVKHLPKESDIALNWTDATATLISGRAHCELQILPASDFPDLNGAGFDHDFEIEAEELSKIIAATHVAVSSEEARYYLQGLHLHAEAGKLVGVATDGVKLSRIAIDAPAGSEEIPGIIVPTKALRELKRLADDVKGQVQIGLSASKLRAKFGDTVLTTKLIDGAFPDYKRVIPDGGKHIAKVNRSALLEAIGRTDAVASTRGHAVKAEFDGGKLIVSKTNPDLGKYVEELEADYDGGTFVTGFNSRFLADLIATLKGDSVTFKMSAPGAPALIEDAADDTRTIVMMPMRY